MSTKPRGPDVRVQPLPSGSGRATADPRPGRSCRSRRKRFDILLFLVERSGHLVQKHELLDHVWPDAAVE